MQPDPEQVPVSIAVIRLSDEIASALASASGLLRAIARLRNHDIDAMWYDRYARILDDDAREIARHLANAI